MSELNKCPKCGDKAILHSECNMFWGKCTGEDCQLETICRFDEPEEAIEDWNKRADGWITIIKGDDSTLPGDNDKVMILVDSHWGKSIQVAFFRQGNSEDECDRINLYKSEDEHGNNRVPYGWQADGGPMTWFGQDVKKWQPLPKLSD
jgi:hypothetical protein